jgi:hypothetical protein
VRDILIAVGVSCVLFVLFYLVLIMIFPSHASTVAAGAFAMAPMILDEVKLRNNQNCNTSTPNRISDHARINLVEIISVFSLFLYGFGNIIGFFNSFLIHSLLDDSAGNFFAAQATAVASLIPAYIFCFLSGKYIVIYRGNRLLSILTISFFASVIGHLLDFLLAPSQLFHAAYPWSKQTSVEFAKFVLIGFPTILVPLGFGTIWYSRQVELLRLNRMIKFLPKATQKHLFELVKSEVDLEEQRNKSLGR